ncbi:carbohydrate ABC transporter permease [Streptomyces althioticus]|jgi:putative aldouronate transport system permease protein|uniref:ABC transporter permease n=1 Tax=Streptomyces griseorubens TaxID=66897 RepID=A0ABR4SY58_9ACTN|nr:MULTISPECIES: carbohydrate ABC transporter permease [Actinomycetes]ALV52471.1 ABC transporter permease [Streptomyces sp. 4F]MCC9688526.1 carbohydrate ABC transporter permease [Streptomyces sp. MNU103]WTB95060.1 carbohydrate ABC transporter permease [Streptomyces althioticus]GGT75013.1 ABC transporter permease [Streptomyces matensis]KEG39686.1 ABC transporter permease [Streptomyces griseorubens]
MTAVLGTRPDPDTTRAKKPGRWSAPPRPVWEEEPSPAGQAGKGLALGLACLAILFPLWIVIVTSLQTKRTIDEAGGLVVIPKGVTFVAYQELLGGGQVQRAALVSVGVTVVGTLFSMAVSVLCAYGLSRSGSLGHRWILMTLLATMFFGAGLIPTYLLVQALGLTDTYLALILPSAVSVFNILVLRAFFMNISQELVDSARIDGAGEWRILFRIVMPLSRAVIAVISLFYAVGYWSAWFNASIYLTDQDMMPLQNVMIQLVQKQERPVGLSAQINTGQLSPLAIQMAVMVLALLPVAVLSPFVQKHFKKGMLTGAVKG